MVTTQERRQECETITGVNNEIYNLIAVTHHLLAACTQYNNYVQDAEQNNNQELAAFFQDLQEKTRQSAHQAQQMLQQRM